MCVLLIIYNALLGVKNLFTVLPWSTRSVVLHNLRNNSHTLSESAAKRTVVDTSASRHASLGKANDKM